MTGHEKTNLPPEQAPEVNQPDKANRLHRALELSEEKRRTRMEQVKSRTGRTDLPEEQRKLTQIEAAAYCGVSTATIHRWKKNGLKTVRYGNRKRFLLRDLQDYIKKKQTTA